MKRALSLLLSLLMVFSATLFVTAAEPKYEFNFDKDDEGWTSGNATAKVVDGKLTGSAIKPEDETKKPDPTITLKQDFDGNTYKYVVATMKYAMKTKTDYVTKVYFTTTDLGLAEDRSVKVTLGGQTSGDAFKTYVFDMSTIATYKGTITSLRFDPFDDEGTWEIDSIKILSTAPAGTTSTQPATPVVTNKFPEVNTFTSSTFSDVSTSAWYYANVGSAFKIGLMKGKAEKTFDPDGQITIAEALAITVRVNDIYNGGKGVFTQGQPWYQVYVDAAVKANIITATQFSDYTRAITRAEMGVLFAKACPNEYYTAINQFVKIPDIDSAKPYFNDILKLYNAGILTGVDSTYKYNPDANIKRCEAAAIITRVCNKSERQRKISPEEQAAIDKAAAEKAATPVNAIRYDFDATQKAQFSLIHFTDTVGKTENGFLVGEAKASDDGKFDPIINIPIDGIDLSKHKTIKVGLKFTCDKPDSQRGRVYFQTVEDPTPDEKKSSTQAQAYGTNSPDKVIELVFDMGSVAGWKGTLKGLRFDPFDCGGTVMVDYIVIQ